MLKIYNTLTRQVEEFKPLNPETVTMYACGPTVYDYQHIGNYRKYIGDDLIRRVLTANGYQIKHVMNITDVGHLVSDADEGEDKMEKGAKESGKTVWEVAKYFEEDFWKWFEDFKILPPSISARATEHVAEMIKLIELLESKGYTYTTEQAIYFDVTKFPPYTELSKQKLAEKEVGVRADVVVDRHKKHPADFALWFFTIGHYKNHEMHWTAPWGEGFPGWHIECSAMSMLYLGDTIDLHTGGIDHIPVHHTNEIAQSEAATGKKFVNYWVHHNFLQVEGEKMSKSKKNYFTPKGIVEKGYELLALRYLYLTAHYRDEINLTWQSLDGATTALNNLRTIARSLEVAPDSGQGQNDSAYYQRFLDAVNNDINIPQALAVVWEMVKSDCSLEEKGRDLLAMDQVLGLGLDTYIGQVIAIPEEVQKLVEKREAERTAKNFVGSDELRDQIRKLGYEVEDTPEGQKVKKL